MQKGVYTLLITPYKDDLSIDEQGLKELVRRQIKAGVQGIAPLGVTGENTLLSEDELKKVLQIVVKETDGKAKIVPDACVTSLWKAKERVDMFADAGADYAAVYAPFLVLPKEEGILHFYEQLADYSKIPIILHNSKGRTCVEITPEMTAKLAKHPNIIGTKDGNKQLDHLAKVISLTKNDDFAVFTGKDTTAYPLICFGGSGTFSVAANLIPEVMKEIIELSLAGELKKAEKIHLKYYDLFEAFRFETNPMAAKMALNLAGLPAGKNFRLPLTPLSNEKTEILKAIMGKMKLLNC